METTDVDENVHVNAPDTTEDPVLRGISGPLEQSGRSARKHEA
jgi:hypothetical protein